MQWRLPTDIFAGIVSDLEEGEGMRQDLKSMTRKELEKLLADIKKALKQAEGRERKMALAAAEKAVKAHGFSLAEIAGGSDNAKPVQKTIKKPKKASPPKYANPEDQSQTWTGRGRKPNWFINALRDGKKPEDVAI